ncbi:YdeI/OmpD-associated family protein [Qipengyuania soli]|uniref:YdeI/OmpD-associated family protein n=1 Tax=Qipengyuania soli TaxID=2782568 RepID=A0A7S8F662_9SPHN|nr:YdeI/OmpD-associated family protein [Qipengyuania soli]QPC99820.1 YdeI/OmpD-associated family protein [Qipengyuania soli]
MKTDPRVDDYIAKAAPFAQPILTHLRSVAREALPQGEEGMKWGMPHFMLGGKNVAGMSAFKAHCAFIVHGEGRVTGADGMGAYGKIASLAELPGKEVLVAAIKAAAERVTSVGSATKGRGPRTAKSEIPVPEDFAAALAKNEAARTAFDGFAPSHRREYLEWITRAKREETRSKRIAQAIEWLTEGRKRNWKYESC